MAVTTRSALRGGASPSRPILPRAQQQHRPVREYTVTLKLKRIGDECVETMDVLGRPDWQRVTACGYGDHMLAKFKRFRHFVIVGRRKVRVGGQRLA